MKVMNESFAYYVIHNYFKLHATLSLYRLSGWKLFQLKKVIQVEKIT